MEAQAIVKLGRKDASMLHRYYETFILADSGNKEIDEERHTEDVYFEEFMHKIEDALKDYPNLNISDGVRATLFSETTKEIDLDFSATPMIRQRMMKNLQAICSNPAYMKSTQEQWPDSNMIIQSYFKAVCDEDKLCSIQDIKQSLLNSKTIYSEIQKLFEHHPEESDDFSCDIVLSKWPNSPLSSYFRGFVGTNGKLNGIGQYFNFLFFPEILPHTQFIQRKFLKFFEDFVEEKIKDKSISIPCLIDLCIDIPENGDKVSLIKITSFNKEDLSEIIKDEMFQESDVDRLLNGGNDCLFSFWGDYVDSDILMRYFTPNEEFLMDEVVYEFCCHSPPKLNLIAPEGIKFFSYCSVL